MNHGKRITKYNLTIQNKPVNSPFIFNSPSLLTNKSTIITGGRKRSDSLEHMHFAALIGLHNLTQTQLTAFSLQDNLGKPAPER